MLRRALSISSSTRRTHGIRVSQTRAHSHSHGHSHGLFGSFGHSHNNHNHSDDNDDKEDTATRALATAADKRAADRVTWTGVYVNVALSGVKGAAGVACHSSALLADAAHSLSDLVSDGVTLVTLQYCAQPPDARQPYGYGKYESVGALAVSLLLVTGSLGIVGHSLETLVALLQSPAVPSLDIDTLAAVSDSFLHAAEPLEPTSDRTTTLLHPAALGIAAVSIVAKEALYRVTLRIGRRVHSSVLVANAWHHRSDAATSVVALAGIGLSLAGLPVCDPLAGIVVGGMLLKMGGEIGVSATRELCDAQLPAPLVRSLEAAVDSVVQASDGAIVAVDQLRSRRVGRDVHVDLTLVLQATAGDSDSVSFQQACAWKEQVKRAVRRQVPRVTDIVVELATPVKERSAGGVQDAMSDKTHTTDRTRTRAPSRGLDADN